MTRQKSAIVLGSSGSVGNALLRELFNDEDFNTVITISRRSSPEAIAMAQTTNCKLIEKIIPDMTPVTLESLTLSTANGIEGELIGFSTLGVGADTTKISLAQHRAVDVALNQGFARGLSESGKVRHLAHLSAVNANSTAKTGGSGLPGLARYNCVKGEAEDAVRASGLAIVSVFRPALIIGSKNTPRFFEQVMPFFSPFMPAKYKPIRTEQIAKAMVAKAKQTSAKSAIYHYSEMLALQALGTTNH